MTLHPNTVIYGLFIYSFIYMIIACTNFSFWCFLCLPYQDHGADQDSYRDYEISEEMRQEMDYNADRAWYLANFSSLE